MVANKYGPEDDKWKSKVLRCDTGSTNEPTPNAKVQDETPEQAQLAQLLYLTFSS